MADETPSASSSAPKTASTRARGAKPRAGIQRKTKEEREQYAKQEAERQAARTAEAARGAGGRGGSRARAGRAGLRGRGGRDGAATQDSRGRDVPTGSGGGVFGATVRQQDARPKILSGGVGEMLVSGQAGQSFERGQPGTADSRSGISGAGGTASGSGGRSGGIKHHPGESIDIATDEEPEELKRDIERIWISSDEDEDDILLNRRKQKALPTHPKAATGLRPVRAPRAPRDEEEQMAAKRRRGSRALKKSDSELHGVEDEDAMDLDDPTTTSLGKERTSSPETRRRSLRKSSGRGREVKFASETIEERAERLRLADDVFKLRQTFSDDPQPKPHPQHQSSSNIIKKDDEDETMNLEAEMEYSSQNLLLFQLPALTPYLHDSSQDPPSLPQVKEEPNDDHRPTTTTATHPSTDPENSTRTGPERILPADGLLTATEAARLPSGLVGKLRVHKSGKVSLDWGGTDMEVRYGTEVDFLQDVVLIEPPISSSGKTKKEEQEGGGVSNEIKTAEAAAVTSGVGKDGQEQDGNHVAHKQEDDKADQDDEDDMGESSIGKTYALGQVRRKLVLIPDWAKLYD